MVGTVNYMTPEMIQESEASCATDLWALGCILFKMYTGKVPFPGMNQASVFPAICARQIDWPKEKNFTFDPQLKDLVDKLLQINPLDRLGCPGTDHDIYKLMKHPFFKGMDFSKLLTETTDVRKAL